MRDEPNDGDRAAAPAQNGDMPKPVPSSAPSQYSVGNKRPPLHSRFKSGQSGNPRGRPPKSRNLQSDLVDELSESVFVREGKQRRRVSKQRALLKALVAEGLAGDVKAIGAVFGHVARLVNNATPSKAEGPMDAADAEIIEDFLARKVAVAVDPELNNTRQPLTPSQAGVKK